MTRILMCGLIMSNEPEGKNAGTHLDQIEKYRPGALQPDGPVVAGLTPPPCWQPADRTPPSAAAVEVPPHSG